MTPQFLPDGYSGAGGDVTLPAVIQECTVDIIGLNAFNNASGITALTLPESVTFIGAEALSGCVNLKKLTILCDPAVLPEDLLADCPADLEICAAANATGEQLDYLSSLIPATETPAGTAASSAQHTKIKYTCVNADVSGFTMDTSMLGGEYSFIFHEDGSVDFTMAGVSIPGLVWTQLENGHFHVDMYGTPLEIVWTDAGFDMDYMGSMMMHFIPAN